jgi:regulator of sigma E protease
VINYIEEGSPAEAAGLQTGDLIKEFNGEKITLGREIAVELYMNPVSKEDISIVYERDGETHTAVVSPVYKETYAIGISYTAQENETATIAAVTEGAPFEKAGGKKGDVIIGIDGTEISDSADLYEYITKHPFSDKEVTITVERDGSEISLAVTPVLSSTGYSMGLSYNTYRYDTTPLETIKYSFAEIKYQISSVFKSLGLLFQGKLGMKDFTGPVGIVDIIGTTYDSAKSEGAWMAFLNVANITILLSANLGVMNLLPIPGVDGGRLLFLLIEAVFRKKVPKKFEGVLTAVCMLLLMIFAVIVMYQDISKLL